MKKEILVVDSNKSIRFMLHTILRKHYKVVSVPDGVSAMYYLRTHMTPDLIIMNPDLSDFPEWELVKYLCGSHLYSSVPVMVISSQNEEQTRSMSIQYNVVKHFVKPFNPLELLEAVDHVLIGNFVSRIF
jgi:two-component system chemotaxis response regulator CheY